MPAVVILSPDELQALLKTAAIEALAKFSADQAELGNRIAFDEPTAAKLMDLESHQLRDERRRGRIGASTIVGRRIRYTREDLLAYLNRERSEARI
ncbi:helix-turn-helix domain-containing protein [Schlesneria paludicola]|uniref:helix-turn-helix domain-containing protein n=1 Tax=Schlesneria paludicola TaxID=360056 RepID=UPI00029B01F5|nr:helix-turn-helix domain-containing protein [Schlesneria paludicola]